MNEMSEINEIKLPKGVDSISVTQHDDKIVIEFIPEKPKFKDGDFVYEDGRIMIVKNYPDNFYALIYPKLDMEPVYNKRYAPTWPLSSLSFRHATEEERQILIDAMRKDGKRWNADKKCIEEIPVYKEGDFLTTVSDRCFILKNICGSKVYDHAFLVENGLDWDNGHCCYLDDIAGYCTPEERLKVISALKKDGKCWNAEKLEIEDIEDIPKRKFKAGDKVKIKDGISSKTHWSIAPNFTELMDKFIGKELTVKEYSSRGWVVFYGGGLEYEFAEDWLEPWSYEPKKGDFAIFWDSGCLNPVIRLYHGKSHSGYWHYDNTGFAWDNAVKWNGTKEQFEKVLRGEI